MRDYIDRLKGYKLRNLERIKDLDVMQLKADYLTSKSPEDYLILKEAKRKIIRFIDHQNNIESRLFLLNTKRFFGRFREVFNAETTENSDQLNPEYNP